MVIQYFLLNSKLNSLSVMYIQIIKFDSWVPYDFINLLSFLKVKIDFYSIGFGNIVALLAQVRICIILSLLTILAYMCIPCFGLL